VTSIEGGDIEVTFTDNANKYLLRQESWENKKYSINETTKEMEGRSDRNFYAVSGKTSLGNYRA